MILRNIQNLHRHEAQEVALRLIGETDFTHGYLSVFKAFCEERAEVLGITWQEYMAEEQYAQFFEITDTHTIDESYID